ncbi:hypothetical protein AMS68_003342 [Peltaster fructicola]|uniref:Uncharacterized protein n=1 Tax=Peltaster fructicola TaxID=286661 RepID=A0A6H0XT50_9PEZI|nr:hypothetical protein AMS68_003342 [Peltaster fructicola]
MSLSLGQRILEREISASLSRRRAYRDFYSDRQLVQDLDIVNELDGHTGCVNALSWSTSGRLLASGSDDQHLNLHVYQPENHDKQFQLQTTVSTGHTANIFSVKFMPQSNDRTVVTCAGDGDVRVFDLEYAGKSTEASVASARATAGRRTRRANVYNGVRYLSDGNTNARVYRSHGDRVKRVVTESSPHLFLTCSEDGEVRQWDTRQPSEAYPRPGTGDDDNVPPPLISYRPYSLDLNTISCAPSQPWYIALGGAHLHCFLHDRRMVGRDRVRESGRPAARSSTARDQEMQQATRCVRKFAPGGQKKMTRNHRSHITACKISDARPDEMIVSWSSDHIYSFNLTKSPDADESVAQSKTLTSQRPRASGLKRRRKTDDSDPDAVRKTTEAIDSAATVRIRYQNGQQEDVDVIDQHVLTTAQIEAQQITRGVLKIHRSLFSHARQSEDNTARFTRTLRKCARVLSDIDEVSREWRYPVDPTPPEVTLQQQLRHTREAVRRFVQAAGTIARVLGGTPRSDSHIGDFLVIDNRRSDLKMSASDMFSFDFIKAILVWLDSGTGSLIESFTRPDGVSESSRAAYRLPIPAREADPEAIEEHLLPYLRSLLEDAEITPITDLEKSRFETDQGRQVYPAQSAAVDAFAKAVSQPFDDLSAATTDEPSTGINRQEAIKFWALRVARGILSDAFARIDAQLIERAFGGIQSIPDAEFSETTELAIVNEANDDEEIEMMIADTEGFDGNGSAPPDDLSAPADTTDEDYDMDEQYEDYFDDDDLMPDDEDDEEEGSSDPDEEDGVPNLGRPRFMYEAANRQRRQDLAARSVPCSAATHAYKGHCNVKTVKDVNYFGLEDEYVVSGSDDGNLFIWDRKTTQLVNVLAGDGEVVNVVQGHPYETMLAVSGIDHTIKIFSPDNHARQIARLGHGVTAHDPAEFSSLAWPNRVGMRRRTRNDRSSGRPVPRTIREDDDDYVAEAGLDSRRRMNEAQEIMENNEEARRQGGNDHVITRSMLQQLAQRMRDQRAAQGDMGSPLAGLETIEDEDGNVRVVLGDDCVLM